MADQCLFCRIVRREIPAKIVLETDECLAFRDINPQAPVHVVVIPKDHVTSLNQAKAAATVGRLGLVAAELPRIEGTAESGYRTVINTNSDAGHPAFHLHLHLLGAP